jgi:hypothetical protein
MSKQPFVLVGDNISCLIILSGPTEQEIAQGKCVFSARGMVERVFGITCA